MAQAPASAHSARRRQVLGAMEQAGISARGRFDADISRGRRGQEADEAGGIWGEGVTALRKVFGQTTIAEVARREAAEAGSGMYFI